MKILFFNIVLISLFLIHTGSCIEDKTEQFMTEKTNEFQRRYKANFILNSSNIIVEGSDDFLKGTFENTTLTDLNYLALKQRIIDNSWQNITNQLSYPSKRYHYSLSYDSFTSKALFFGGSDPSSGDRLGDTWIYDYPTNTWTQMSPSTSPSARDQFAMVYNTNLKNIILFGGRDDSNSVVGDTWIYDMSANTWTNVTPSTSPSARYRHAMAYDSNANQVVLFGGTDEGGTIADTWVFNPLTNTWTQMFPTTSPSIRYYHAMVYHSESAKIVLYGGRFGGIFNDTWVYDLATNIWTNLNPSPSPGEREKHTLAYDSTSNKVVLFGGGDNDTWMYNILTNAWQLIATVNRPTNRYSHSLFYDSPSNRIILFGGYKDLSYIYNDTWIYPSNKYYKNGTFTSRIYSLTNINRVAGILSWNPFSQPVNTNLKIQIGFSNTTKEEDFSYTTYSASNFTFSSIAKYLRYRVSFESNMFQLATPFLKNVQLEYSISIPTFPNAPKNLVASINNHLVELSWTPPSDNGGSSIIRYNLYRGTLSGNYMFLGVTSNTNYIDSTTLPGVTYYYVVTARYSVGESLFSNEVSATPTPPPTTQETTSETTTTTTEAAGTFPGVLAVLVVFSTLVIFTRRRRRT